MQESIAPNKLVSSILHKQVINNGVTYTPSVYAYPYETNNSTYLFNTLTRQCYELDDLESRQWLSMDDALISGFDIGENAFLTELMESHFLVPQQRNESDVYEELINIASSFDRRNGFTSYTIMPTTACNARCFYCYEEGFIPSDMNQETLEQLITFILKTKDDGPIVFNWFGGEPLLGIKTIDALCNEMRVRSVDFRSSIVTNGILMDEGIVPRIIKDWNLTFAQFSLDGSEEEYNRRKNYKVSYPSAYKKVLKNVRALACQDVDITIRCNIDRDNEATLDSFLDDVSNIIPASEKISIVFLPLYDLQCCDDGCNDLWERCREMRQKAQSRGFRLQKSIDIGTLSVRACMAQDVNGSVTITPTGELYTCEHCIPGMSTGNIWGGIENTEIIENYGRHAAAEGDCRICQYLPFCTTFDLCPIKRVNCKWVMKQWLDEALDIAIMQNHS